MSLYEFLMTIASVVIAFGIGELAKYWGELVRKRKLIKKYSVPQIIWSLNLLFVGTYYWIGMWAYSSVEFVYFFQVFALVIPTLFFVVACYAISNISLVVASCDLENQYWLDTKVIFIPMALFSLSSLLADIAIVGHIFSNVLITLVITGLMLSLGFVKSHMYHYVVTGINCLLYVVLVAAPLSSLGQ